MSGGRSSMLQRAAQLLSAAAGATNVSPEWVRANGATIVLGLGVPKLAWDFASLYSYSSAKHQTDDHDWESTSKRVQQGLQKLHETVPPRPVAAPQPLIRLLASRADLHCARSVAPSLPGLQNDPGGEASHGGAARGGSRVLAHALR